MSLNAHHQLIKYIMSIIYFRTRPLVQILDILTLEEKLKTPTNYHNEHIAIGTEHQHQRKYPFS